jgi:hypothetical protein
MATPRLSHGGVLSILPFQHAIRIAPAARWNVRHWVSNSGFRKEFSVHFTECGMGGLTGVERTISYTFG